MNFHSTQLDSRKYIMDKMKFETPDMTAENIEKIAELFPNCVTEMRDENGKIKHGITLKCSNRCFPPTWWTATSATSLPGWVKRLPFVVQTSPPEDVAPLSRGEQRLGHDRKPLYRGRQSGSFEAFAGKLSRQGKNDLYRSTLYTETISSHADDFMRSRKRKTSRWGCTMRTITDCSKIPIQRTFSFRLVFNDLLAFAGGEKFAFLMKVLFLFLLMITSRKI